MKALTHETSKLLKPANLTSRDRLRIQVNKDLSKFVVRPFRSAEGGVAWPSHEALTAIARVPERRQLDGSNTFELGASDISVAIIKACWPADQLDFDVDAKTVFDYYTTQVATQEVVADAYARYREYQVAKRNNLEASAHSPQMDLLHVDTHPVNPLSLYQRVAASNSMMSEGYGLFMEQGTGKTPVIIARICTQAVKHKAKTGRAFRAIVCCPNNVRLNWVSEFQKFATCAGNITVIRGGSIRRIKQMIEAMTLDDSDQFTVVVVGYDSMPKTPALYCVEWDLAVADEGHYFKSPTTTRFKFMMRLRDVAASRVVLTGTPIANTPLDIYAMFEFMGKGYSGFVSWSEFRKFYGVFDDSSGQSKLVGIQNKAFMQERLARLSFRITKKEALPDLPDKVYDVIEVEMTPEQKDLYQQVASQLAVEIENELDSSENKELTINNVLTKLLRLAQITAGFIVWDEVLNPDTLEVVRPRKLENIPPRNPKLDMLIETLKEKGPDNKTIIWAIWQHDIKAIMERLAAEGIDAVHYYGGTSQHERAEAERRFNGDPICKAFVGNAAAGGTGLNLLGYPPGRDAEYTTNADHVIYYTSDWSGLKRWQSEDRAHRRGTRCNVRISDLVAPQTIDEEIRARVVGKAVRALEIQDIRAILKTVLGGLKEEEASNE